MFPPRHNNRFIVDCPVEAGRMWTDMDKVRRCLINLLGNASKFTERGTVTLSVRRWEKEGADWVTFRVQDTGKGMNPEELGRLFRPFSQVSSSLGQQFGGHGLGLAITKDLCERLGGGVRAESEVGKGSVFIMDLPTARPHPEAAEDHPRLASAASIQGIGTGCVLVIDDDPAIRRILATMLAREGFRVAVATGGEDGLRQARELRPTVITLDVLMPDLDGWTVLSRLKADPELAAIPVVMLSIWPETQRAFALGVADYLSKPIDKARLVAVLKNYYSPSRDNAALIVDDDPDIRLLLRQMLEGEGWNARLAENGRVALEQIQRVPPSLIILDLMMPVMDGFQLVAELQRHDVWRGIPVVVVSAKDLAAEDKERLGGQVIEILRKGSFDREELLQTVRQSVRRFLPRGPKNEALTGGTSESAITKGIA